MGYTLIISYVRRLAPLFLFETSRDAVTPKAHAVTDIHAGELTYWIGPQSGKEIGLDYDGDGKVSEDEGNYTVKVYENCKEAGEEEGWSKKLMDRL